MSKFLWIIFVVVIVSIVSIFAYKYFTSEDFKIYDEALVLYDDGKLEEAHDKLLEALKIRQTNRKALALKGKIYPILLNYKLLENAQKEYEKAENAIDRGDYSLAADYLDIVLQDLSLISISSDNYDEAMAFQNKVIITSKELILETPAKYYNKSVLHMENGDYERAYNTLTYIGSPDTTIIKLKNDLAYTIAIKQYDKIMSSGDKSNEFILRDTVLWFEKITKASDNFIESKEKRIHIENILKNSGFTK